MPVVTGDGEAAPVSADSTATEPTRSDKPILVYVTAMDTSAPEATKEAEKVDKIVLADERVALGARAFRRVKVLDCDVAGDPLLAKSGTGVPRFVVISADYKTAKVVEKNRLTPAGLWDAMTETSSKFYATTIDDAVKKTRDVLIEYDKIAGEKEILEAKKARLGEKASDADVKAIETKLTAIEARQQKTRELEQKIWELKPKV